ncbi:MAG: rod shape-determining protein RodA [Nitriliruptoraceae bacterium]
MSNRYTGDPDARRLRAELQSRWMDAYAPTRHVDTILVVAALALAGIGLVMIFSAKLHQLTLQGLPNTLYLNRQLVALAIGLVVMVVASMVDYRRLQSYVFVLYGTVIVLLIAVLTPLGNAVGGSQRWLVVGPAQLQPSELAKVAVLIAIAALLSEAKAQPGLGEVAIGLVIAVVPTVLVFVQPDLGTSMVFVFLAAGMFLVGGVRVRYLVALVIAGIVGFLVSLQTELIQDYQVRRLTAFLDASDPALAQGAAFHTRQSLIAVGSGQLSGKGLFQGTQTALAYVPENHTDFIFTVVGEEFGFVGTSAVVALFAVLVWRALMIAATAKDLFGRLVASGIASILTFQVFVNVGMTIGLMPVTGLPLPFVSYGGTSLIMWFSLIGVLQSIHMRRF